MYDDIIYNRHMFYRDKIYEYKRFCERMATTKSKCHPPPPTIYPFLKHRMKKRQMEKEKQEDIEYNKTLLIKKYKSMYKNHNKYHPSNLQFLSLPSSLKFSPGSQNHYELVHQNTYLGNKIKQIQNGIGNYNSKRIIEDYKKSKELSNKIAERSKYKNMLLNIVSPFTYEKRLNKLLERNKNEKRLFSAALRSKFHKTDKDFYQGFHINSFINSTRKNNIINNFNNNNKNILIEREKNNITSDHVKEKKIFIERENLETTTKEKTDIKI